MSLKTFLEKQAAAGKAAACEGGYLLSGYYSAWSQAEKTELISLMGEKLGEVVTEEDCGGFPAFGYCELQKARWHFTPDSLTVEVRDPG